ncbi:glycosyltransferase family 39 protein [Fusobacterium sp.]|uniref:ArnT family glycosyltransferase n=1 Tax=Fusobacterium sp. TaxID=68766 RepID=UPI00260B9AB5|nr:glycosyltransferase family 39 protein [Fusobacterium sp.]
MDYIKYGHHISYKNFLKIFLIYLLIFIPILIMRYPDIRNELKYFIVVDDILESKNYFILKYFTELYPDKPPLFFWLLVFIKKYFSNYYIQMAVFLGSVLPSFLITIFSYSIFSKIKDEKAGFFIALSLCTMPFFIGASLVLRMDMLMNLFIFMSLYTFFNLYFDFVKSDFKNISRIYIYIFLGLFTKGIAGVIVPVITILIFLILENNLSFLKKIHFFKGILFILMLLILWGIAIILSSSEGKEYLLLMIGQETIGRVMKAKTHIKPFYYYLKIIPILIYPYGIFFLGSLFYYIKNIKSYKNWDYLEKIGFSWTIFPLIAFSCASGKLEIYLLPTFIGMILMIYSFLMKIKGSEKEKIFVKISMIFSVLPYILNYFFNKEKNFYKKIIYFPMSMIIVFALITPFVRIYNKNYSLEPIKNTILYNSSEKLIAYKFIDFINMKNEVNEDIIPMNDKENLKELMNNNRVLIVARHKYKKDLDDLKNLNLLYENKNYLVFSN